MLPTSAVVPLRNGMKDSLVTYVNITSAYPCLLMYALTTNRFRCSERVRYALHPSPDEAQGY